MRFGKAIIFGLAIATASVVGCSSQRTDHGAHAGQTGTVGLQLQLPGGLTLNAVNYSITASGGTVVKSGTINLTNSSSIAAVIGGIPVGSYTVTLTGVTTDGAYTCSGAGTVSVTANATSAVTIHMNCSTEAGTGSIAINADVTACSVITSLGANPAQAEIGSRMTLSASSNLSADGGALTYAWTVSPAATATVASPTALDTTLLCNSNGEVTVTLTVAQSGSQACTASQSITVLCGASVFCGDGVCNGLETSCTCSRDCGAETTGNNLCCTDVGETAANEPACIRCGDQICSRPTETDTSCAADCVACGDGTCSAGETYALCAQDCPAACGNGVCESPAETLANCAQDCTPTAVCGDGTCAASETATSCPQDCRTTLSILSDKNGTACTTCAETNCFGPQLAFTCENDPNAINKAACLDTLSCLVGAKAANSCALANFSELDCYCGTPNDPNTFDCNQGIVTSANGTPGACVALEQSGFSPNDHATIFNNFADPTQSAGAANNIVHCLVNNGCDTSCLGAH